LPVNEIEIKTLFLCIDYFTSLDFYRVFTTSKSPLLLPSTTASPINKNNDTKNNTTPITTTNDNKPILLIDTSSSSDKHKTQVVVEKNNNDNNKNIQQKGLAADKLENSLIVTSPTPVSSASAIEFRKQDNVTKLIKQRRRHNSVSSSFQSNIDILSNNKSPHLSPSTSSVSSHSSNWSLDSKQSRVEEMIFLFETGGHHLPNRRYSVDSHNYYTYKPLIRERKFEYKPIASEWKKRASSGSSGVFPFELSVSKST
jgi:hypothetical protein